MQLPLTVEGEWPFIDGDCRAVQEDHSVIIGQPSIEGVAENFGVKEGRCQIETKPRM